MELTEKGLSHKLLTKSEAAALLRISTPTLDDYVRIGFLSKIQIGRRVYFDSDEIFKRLSSIRKRNIGGRTVDQKKAEKKLEQERVQIEAAYLKYLEERDYREKLWQEYLNQGEDPERSVARDGE